MIRYANDSDVPRLVELGRLEHAGSPLAHIPFDAEHAAAASRAFMARFGTTTLLSPGGYIAGLVQPMHFTRDLMALEYLWFAIDGSGLQLLAAFQSWAKGMGAKHITVQDPMGNGRISRVLVRKGWKQAGGSLVRGL